MPMYEFICESCGKKFEGLVSIDTKSTICNECGGEAYKIMSAPSFHLKGGCWAKDNYGLKQNNKDTGGGN